MKNAQVVRIQRIQNMELWKRYAMLRPLLKTSNEMKLWHGTRNQDPALITQSGVDFRFAAAGMWGRGAYFAYNASYSHGYAHESDGLRHFFVCRVELGRVKDLSASSDRNLVRAPIGFDSVQGATGGSTVFIVYDIAQSYPEYLVSYRVVQ
eukprot:c9574_g1_i1.p1 GENE.c9574_g1_i1~~c9574_g1_i1.p1  ORF type:complete len:151 (-),score=35.78 c9574_g1_i1:97-549(-)